MIVAPRHGIERGTALTARTHYLKLDVVDRDLVQEFVDVHIDEGPKRIASQSDRWDDCN